MITAEYLPGVLNFVADWESRNFHDSSEWQLAKWTFQLVCQKLGIPVLDLFASRACHQLSLYVAWKPDPMSQAIDAFQLNWKNRGLTYAFPPFCLIGKTVTKVRSEKATQILVTPHWPAQSWYNQVLELCVADPILVKPRQDLLMNPQGQVHPLVENQTLNLVAWKISGKDFLQKAYQQGLQTLSSKPGERALELVMNRPGANGFAGVVNDKLIPMSVV